MNRIDDANTKLIYTIFTRALNVQVALRSIRDVAVRLMHREHPPLASPSTAAVRLNPQAAEPLLGDVVQSSAPRATEHEVSTPAERLSMAKVFWCCSPRFEAAFLSLFALNLAPMWGFIRSAMKASTRDITYFLRDTAAYIVSKMWDDMLAADLFRMTTVFLCSPEHGRPCNPPASVGTQLRYCAVLLVLCAFLKTHVERFYSRRNRGSLIVPGMLGMLVGWAFGRAFQQVRAVAEARILGCDVWASSMLATGGASLLSPPHEAALASAAPAAHPWPPPPPLAVSGDFDCAVLTPSAFTTSFRILYAACVTVGSSLLILLLEPAAALETLGSSSWRRRLGVEVKSLVQLLCKAAATTSMIQWNDALTGTAESEIEPRQKDVRVRMLLCYSLAMTFGGSAVSLQFQSWSRQLASLADEAARVAGEEAAKKREMSVEADLVTDQMRRLSEQHEDVHRPEEIERMEEEARRLREAEEQGEVACTVPAEPAPAPAESAANMKRKGSGARLARMMRWMGQDGASQMARLVRKRSATRRLLACLHNNLSNLRLRIHFFAASLRALAVLEATLGFVAGCAWTEYTVAIYPTIAAFPDSPWVAAAHVCVAVLLSALAIVWITFTGPNGSRVDGKRGEREVRERIFISGAFSFFSGWAWIAVVRCILVVPYAIMPQRGLGWRHAIELVLSTVFCPVATWLVIRAAFAAKNAYEAHAGLHMWRRHVNAIRAFTRARSSLAQRRQRASCEQLA